MSSVANGIIVGFGTDVYRMAVNSAKYLLKKMTKIDKNLIKELSESMDKNNLSELKYSDGKFNYELKKGVNKLIQGHIIQLQKKI